MGSLSRTLVIARLESCSVCLFMSQSIVIVVWLSFSQWTLLELGFNGKEAMIIKALTLNVQVLTCERERPQFRSKAYLEEMVGFGWPSERFLKDR